MKPEILQELDEIKESMLVLDIETSAFYPGTTEEINIFTNFEDYVKYAKVKWVGMYSFKDDKLIMDNVVGNEQQIKDYIAQHKYIVGFNNQEFDVPIMYNNDLMPEDGYFKQLDMLQILGSSTYKNHAGLPFKNRGMYMGLKFPKNSLRAIAEVMQLEVQKGDIDYKIFHKNTWTDEETEDIKKYLKSDILSTKQMFEKVWDYYLPFCEFIDDRHILDLSWFRSSIASLTYKAACHVLGVEDTYSDKRSGSAEEMGGRVIEPKYEEAKNVWYVDFTSLYPHIFCMFNLFAEEQPDNLPRSGKLWSGNELFRVKGIYNITDQHPLAIDVAEKLKMRIDLKKNDPKNPLQYAIKIFLNALYGAVRSPIFEQIHTENAGWDCCWLGQQIQKLTEDMMTDFGFETIAGDTDSIFVRLSDTQGEKIINHETEEQYVRQCLKAIVQKIKDNVPFPADTYDIDIEDYLEYAMWPFSDQPIEWNGESDKIIDILKSHTKLTDPEIEEIIEFNKDNVKLGTNLKNLKKRLIKVRKGKKKNYVYMTKKNDQIKIEMKGLPIKKDGATLIGPKIYEEILKPQMIEHVGAKFSKEYIHGIIEEYLLKPGSLELLAREYRVKPLKDYKNENQIQAQISAGYFNGQDGIISLIKNKKCGRAGKTAKYCTAEEARENNLTINDLDLEKLYNELEPFIGYTEKTQ